MSTLFASVRPLWNPGGGGLPGTLMLTECGHARAGSWASRWWSSGLSEPILALGEAGAA